MLQLMSIICLYRMRNLSNKVTFAKELLGLSKKTPMAIFLQEIGLEVDLKFAN
jgi:hypothetical protein